MALILPKQTATKKVIDIVLKIFYDQDLAGKPLVSNKQFKKELIDAGIDAQDPAGLVKQSEMLLESA